MFILLSLMIIFLIYGCGFIYIFASNEKSEKVLQQKVQKKVQKNSKDHVAMNYRDAVS